MVQQIHKKPRTVYQYHHHHQLPEELLYEILLKVPGKDLLRFQTVCKSWRFLISDPKFINQHLRVSKPEIVFQTIDENRKYEYISFELQQPSMSADLPIQDVPVIMSSCNGLLVLGSYRNPNTVYIYNPVTRHSHRLPPTRRELGQFFLVHDSSIGKYKLFGVDDYSRSGFVFTQGGKTSKDWRPFHIHSPPPASARYVLLPGCAGEMRVHWMLNSEVDGKQVYYICSIDIATEKLTLVEIPSIVVRGCHLQLSQVRGHLFVTSDHHQYLETWVFEDRVNNLWTKTSCLSLQPLYSKLSQNFGLVVLRDYDYNFGPCNYFDHCRLLVRCRDRAFVYDLKNQNLKEIVSPKKKFMCVRRCQIYHSSLVNWE